MPAEESWVFSLFLEPDESRLGQLNLIPAAYAPAYKRSTITQADFIAHIDILMVKSSAGISNASNECVCVCVCVFLIFAVYQPKKDE